MLIRIILAMLIVSPSAIAEKDEYRADRPAATVEKLRGEVKLSGKLIKEGDGIFKSGKLETGDKSFVKVYIDRWGSEVSLGPNSSMDLKLDGKPSEPKHYTLQGGVCRWVTKFKRDGVHNGTPVRARSASMGIRGTDFKVIQRDGGETEIIVFDGEVLFKSKLAKSQALVKSGQWGGVGGKFGKKVTKLVNLSEDDLEKMKEDVE